MENLNFLSKFLEEIRNEETKAFVMLVRFGVLVTFSGYWLFGFLSCFGGLRARVLDFWAWG